MPTLTQVHLPPPKSWEEFEDIVASAIGVGKPSSPPQRFGRRGQKQQGVDVYYEDEATRRTGVQCKLVSEFSIDQIRAEVADAEAFEPKLESYILALAAQRDATLQKLVYKLSAERKGQGKFSVTVWFWEDIAFMLSRDTGELARHYPQMFAVVSTAPVINDPIRTEQTKRRIAAHDELWSYRRRSLPTKRHPDMDWGDALEEIALDFDTHAKALEDMVLRLGPTLPTTVSDELIAAANLARDGVFEVSLVESPNVTSQGRDAAEKMYDALGRAVSGLQASLERDGVRFD